MIKANPKERIIWIAEHEPRYLNDSSLFLKIEEGRTSSDLLRVAARMRPDRIALCSDDEEAIRVAKKLRSAGVDVFKPLTQYWDTDLSDNVKTGISEYCRSRDYRCNGCKFEAAPFLKVPSESLQCIFKNWPIDWFSGLEVES